MTSTNLIAGLQIIEKYKPVDDIGYHIRAEHDTIYVGSLKWGFSKDDIDTLEAMGWEMNSEIDGWIANL